MQDAAAKTIFGSRAWRETAGWIHAATGASVSVVDLGSGATHFGGPMSDACSLDGRTAAGAGVACLTEMADELGPALSRTTRGGCELGCSCVVTPVRLNGDIVCHVLVSGFVASERERARVLRRLLSAGADEGDARTAVGSLPLLDKARAEATAHLAASFLESSLRAWATTLHGPDRSSEIGLLEGVVEGLVPDHLADGRFPKGMLQSIQRVTGAEGVRIVTVSETSGRPDVVCETGAFAFPGNAPEDADSAAERAVTTGRTVVVSGAGSDGDARVTVVASPILRGGAAVGSLLVSRASLLPLAGEDLRLVELAAEIASAVFDASSEYREAGTRLVELVQVNEVARALNATLDFDRLSELAVQILEKTLDFGVGGFVVDGFGIHRGHLVQLEDMTEGDLAAVLAEVGPYEGGWPVEGIAISSRMCALEPGEMTPGGDWTVLARELMFRNIRVGTLFVAASEPGRFRTQDERILSSLGSHLSIALENASLYQRLAADVDRTMAALAAFADAGERYLPGHTDRVMDNAVAIGQEMGLSIERIQVLRFAGLLHDLGKLGVAEDVLVKPSALTPEEMERVRRHSVMGASIVEQIRLLDEISPVVRHHHERVDGKGYPDGLAGDDIPLEARILAVADSFEAMTGARAHRKRLPAATARVELERAAGTQFDPEVVAAMGRVLDRRAQAAATGIAASAASAADGQKPLPA